MRDKGREGEEKETIIGREEDREEQEVKSVKGKIGRRKKLSKKVTREKRKSHEVKREERGRKQ